METREIKKHSLDFEKTIPYFRGHIECGNTLSQRIVEKINFHQGRFYTFLPANAILSNLYEFPYKGLIPSIPYGTRTYKIKGLKEPFHPRQVITMDGFCSEFILNYVKATEKNLAIIENCIGRSDDPHIDIINVRMCFYSQEVYYLLNNRNSLEEICSTMRKSNKVWHTMIVLSKEIGEPPILDEDSLDRICNNTQILIAGAYDGEGYIFWEKD